jgi:hypothetical protein
MFSIFEKELAITIIMFTLLFLSIFTRLLLGFLYQRMIKEADSMATTKNKLLKQCKLKFANCYQLNNGVSNIPIFVDKFLNKLAVGPFGFETMYHISGQMMLLSAAASGVGICKCIVQGSMLGEILPFYIAIFLGLYLYFSLSSIVDIKGRKRVLKINLIDYLENHLSARMDITESDMEMLFGKSAYGKNREKGKKDGRKTVELMPFGNRLAAAEHIDVIEDREPIADNNSGHESKIPASDQEESARLLEGIRREIRKSAAGTDLLEGQDELLTKDQEIELGELLKEFLTS